MSARDDETALRGHGGRPTCDHECTRTFLGVGDKMWCGWCGALHADGQWKVPLQLSAAIRDRDTMCDTLTIVQERCTAQQEEIRILKARLERYGG